MAHSEGINRDVDFKDWISAVILAEDVWVYDTAHYAMHMLKTTAVGKFLQEYGVQLPRRYQDFKRNAHCFAGQFCRRPKGGGELCYQHEES